MGELRDKLPIITSESYERSNCLFVIGLVARLTFEMLSFDIPI